MQRAKIVSLTTDYGLVVRVRANTKLRHYTVWAPGGGIFRTVTLSFEEFENKSFYSADEWMDFIWKGENFIVLRLPC